MDTQHVKCLIIGGGPAGYTAAIYASRSALSPVLYEGNEPGGQLTTTTVVENFPGFPGGVDANRLMSDMREQARLLGADIRRGAVTEADLSSRPFRFLIDGETSVEADAVIIATGATAKYLGLPSESRFKGMGVSACATCDGFFYRRKDVAVVGGGDTACEEATYLAGLCRKVYMIVRRDVLRASEAMQERVRNTENIEILWNCNTREVLGDANGVTGARLERKNGEVFDISVDGFFLAIGHHPASELFSEWVKTDENGYIVTEGVSSRTSVDGVFAAGDVQDPHYRQAINAAADDPAVKFIYLKTDGVLASISQLEELRKALSNFRLSGKPVIAYTINPTTGSYYLASVADKVYSTDLDGTSINIIGISGRMVFLKDLLDKLGVNMQLIRHGKYKSAGEMYIANTPSEANLEQNTAMVTSLWNSYAGTIAESRGIEPAALDSLVDNLCLNFPEDFLNAGLVDQLTTREEFKNKLTDLAMAEDYEDINFIPFPEYVKSKVKSNLKAKRKLIEEIEAYEASADDAANAAAMQDFAAKWQAIGFVPFKEKDAVNQSYKEAMQAKFPGFGSRNQRGAGRSQGKAPRSEKDILIQKYNQLQQDIATYENNIGFFAMSKNAESLIKQMQERIEEAKNELKGLEAKIRQAEEASEE